jgi:hypothetical protein
MVSDNQNIHQLLHRLALEQTITNLGYKKTTPKHKLIKFHPLNILQTNILYIIN